MSVLMNELFPTDKKKTSEEDIDQEKSDGSANAFEGTEVLRDDDDTNDTADQTSEKSKKKSPKDDGSAY